MDILFESYIQTLHPAQLLMLEEFLKNHSSSSIEQRNFKRIIHIILHWKWQRISEITRSGMKTAEMNKLFGNHPKLKQLIDSVEKTIEGTREISKERDFDQALEKLFALRRTGFLPNIVTLKRLITKTRWELRRLKILEWIITEEGISKNKSYLFYVNLIQSGAYRGSHSSPERWTSAENIRNSGKYAEAIAAWLSHDFAYALAQGQFGGTPGWSDIKPTSHGAFRWRK